MPLVAQRELPLSAGAQGERWMGFVGERLYRVAHEVEQRLDHLIAIDADFGNAGIVIAYPGEKTGVFRFNQSAHMFQQLVHVGRCKLWQFVGAQQPVNEIA